MSEEKNQPASADAQPQVVEQLEKPAPQQVAPPASEQPEEVWDQDRAMETIKKLREIEKQAKKDQKEFERLKADEQKRIEAQMTETERLQKQVAEFQQKNAELETNMLRRDVIAEIGLPPQFADRLKGSTREELVEDAKALAALLPKQSQKSQAITNPGNASLNETDAQKRERLFGKQSNIFDIKEIEAHGGGVVWHSKE